MKCQVKWVNAQGRLTPDTNDAVMMAHFHEPIWGTPGPNNKIQGYSATVRESFPICAAHYAMVDASFRLPRGGWTFTPIAESCVHFSDENCPICHPLESESDIERDRR
jgi:hypothetical protein